MPDRSVVKVQSGTSPRGEMGQKYLAAGTRCAMRLWDEEPTAGDKAVSCRDYETLGYVIDGKAELELDGQLIALEPGDSWVVPRAALHRYRILEHFVAVEVTSPPAFSHGRDRPMSAEY